MPDEADFLVAARQHLQDASREELVRERDRRLGWKAKAAGQLLAEMDKRNEEATAGRRHRQQIGVAVVLAVVAGAIALYLGLRPQPKAESPGSAMPIRQYASPPRAQTQPTDQESNSFSLPPEGLMGKEQPKSAAPAKPPAPETVPGS